MVGCVLLQGRCDLIEGQPAIVPRLPTACRNVVEPLLAPCKRLLLLVGCELGQLMSLLKTARVQGRATLRTVSRSGNCYETLTTRILFDATSLSCQQTLAGSYEMLPGIETAAHTSSPNRTIALAES